MGEDERHTTQRALHPTLYPYRLCTDFRDSLARARIEVLLKSNNSMAERGSCQVKVVLP